MYDVLVGDDVDAGVVYDGEDTMMKVADFLGRPFQPAGVEPTSSYGVARF